MTGVSLEDMDGLFSIPTYKTCWVTLTGKKLHSITAHYVAESSLPEKGIVDEAETTEVEGKERRI